MSTIREQILTAIATSLGTITDATGGVYRSRVGALTRSQTPSIVVEPVEDTADPSTIGVIFWSLLLRVAVVVRGTAVTDAPDQLADPIVKEIHDRMISDKSLGGISMDIEPVSVKFEIVEGDQPIGVISLGYKVDYRTKAEDLSTTI